MIKHRVYQDQPLAVGRTIELDQRAAHHLLRVLRLRAGERLALFNGDGGEYTARLEVQGKRASACIVEHASSEMQRGPAVDLIQSVSRGDRMDWSVQKAVELGVNRIVPVYSERSIRVLDDKREQKKMQHWEGVIISACEQSGRCRLPALESPLGLNGYLAQRDRGIPGFVLDPVADRSLVAALAPCDRLELLVGPEGGWTAEEVEAALAAGFTAATLGPRTLRTETAGLAALAVVQSRLGDLA